MARSVPVLSQLDISLSNLFRESLSQLSDLLEKGEKRGIFSSRMPASIERSIREENLRFMQNRDVFSEDYYSFLYEVTHNFKRQQSSYFDYSLQDPTLQMTHINPPSLFSSVFNSFCFSACKCQQRTSESQS